MFSRSPISKDTLSSHSLPSYINRCVSLLTLRKSSLLEEVNIDLSVHYGLLTSPFVDSTR